MEIICSTLRCFRPAPSDGKVIPAPEVKGPEPAAPSVQPPTPPPSLEMKGCCTHGPGYASPTDAVRGPREKYLFVTCPNLADSPDVIATVDVDPSSPTYCKVVSKVVLPNVGDEVHHTGWNACSSCFDKKGVTRSTLVVPCLGSSRIYFIDVVDPLNLKLNKVVEPKELFALDLSAPHTAHCLPDGQIMISTIGDAQYQNKGTFVLLDSKDFAVKSTWPVDGKDTKFGYDFWYQPRCNVMISTEWGVPDKIRKGFNPAEVAAGHYGNECHVWEWDSRRLLQSIALEGPEGLIPLEVRFLHEPTQPHAFVGTALGSSVFHLYRENDEGEFKARLAATVPAKKVEGWALPSMPALITDIIVSMDDRYLYASCWLHGDIRQYDISDPHNIKLVGQVFIGGSIHTESGVTLVDEEAPEPLYVQENRVEGGPQMLQLSLDGKRLYVTTSLYSVWDRQFYPALAQKGAVMLQIDVDTENGGMHVNKDFYADFSDLPNGPYLAHEMRYPGGDCTSDIWI